MPSSYPESIAPIIQLIAHFRPKSILDVGPGRAKYGVMIREYFYDRGDTSGQHWPYVEKVDCCEVFEPYISPVHKEVYDEIFIGNALEMEHGQYDMYFCVDVVEHWPREQAFELLDTFAAKGNVLVSIPIHIGNQGPHFGNDWESHISSWKKEDFYNRYTVLKDSSNDCSYILVFTK